MSLKQDKEELLKEKQYEILLNTISQYIQAEDSRMKKYDGLNCGIPVVICVNQKYDYKGNFVYSIHWSNMGLTETPTSIEKILDRYVLFKLHKEKPLSKNLLPEIILKDCTEEDESIIIINELSWVVLMCKYSTKHIVVKDIVSTKDRECIEQFDNFSCE